MSLFDLDNRKIRKQIENTFRLLYHNNNVVFMGGLPENFKKFISAKLNEMFFKQCTLDDCINGSKVKKILQEYKGEEIGAYVLSLAKNEVLHYNGSYCKHKVPYLKEYDTKAKNVPILVTNRVTKNVQKKCVQKNVPN